jgi:peptide/nickel transport system permease protein
MTRYLARRLASSAITIVLLALIVFLVARVLPGDPALIRAGSEASPALIAEIRAQYGIDLPLYQQFLRYVSGLLHGDFGTSMRTNGSVTRELLGYLPASLELSLAALIVAAVVGVSAGTIASLYEGRWPDSIVRGFTALGGALPAFWVSLLAISTLVYRFGVFPSPRGRLPRDITPPSEITGFYSLDALLAGDLSTAKSALWQLALPALILGVLSSISLTRITRGAMINALGAPNARAARGLNLRGTSIIFGEGMRNAFPTIITSLGLVAGHLIAGNIIIEQIFAWPGIGRYLATAITYSDLDVVQGFVIVVGIGYVVINVLVDVAYAAADPRIRLGDGK